MSNLLKSKFFLGLTVLALMLVADATASAYTQTVTLRMGQSSSQVLSLQQALNGAGFTVALSGAGSPGMESTYFGSRTKAAVMAFQSAHGLVADGVVGPMTGGALSGAPVVIGNGVYPAGCASSTGFSSTTGMACSGGILPAGCTTTSGFSPVTGGACNGTVSTSLPAGCATASGFSSTTGQACTTTSTVSGTNGYLADLSADSTNRVSTVYESEQDKVVAGFRATARLSSQVVDRVRVTFVNTNTATSANLAKYISGASLWYGSSKIATMAVTDADRATSSDTYTFNFSGLHANIAKDQIGRFYVSVNVNGSLDSTDTASAKWYVEFVAGGISATSPDGSSDTYPSSLIAGSGTSATNSGGLSFGKFSANGVKATVNLSSSNPAATTLAVNNTAATNAVTVLKFTVKATNSDLTIRKVPIQVTSTTSNVSTIVNTIKLYRGTDLIDSLDGSAIVDVSGAGTTLDAADTSLASGLAGGYIFTNLSSPGNKITSGDTAEFSVVLDIKAQSNFTAGSTIFASLTNQDLLLAANFSVQDTNGDQLTNASSSIRVGSAVGQVMTLLVNGINVVMGGPTVTTTTDTGLVVSATWSIPFTATAFGNTLYLGPAVGRAIDATPTVAESCTAANDVPGMSGAVAATCGLIFAIENSGNTVVTTGNTAVALSTNDATIETTGYRLDSGDSKDFTLTITLAKAAASGTSSAALTVPAFYKARLAVVHTYTNGALSSGTAVQDLLPTQNYRTAPVNIQN